MIIGGNFLAPLFPCKLQRILENNMYVKHILGLLTLIFFVEMTSDIQRSNLWETFGTSFILYLWFVLTTAMEAKVFLVLVVLFAIMYTLTLYREQVDKKADEDSIRLSANLHKLESGLYYLSIILTAFGVIAYYGRKHAELGSSFSFLKFFIGKTNCKGTSGRMGVFKAFRKAFE
jgi:Ca2+/Na+ antiporter